MYKIIFIIVSISIIMVSQAFAIDDPHGAASSINCDQCHIPHNTLGDILVNSTDSLISTLCLSCHTPGGWAGMTKYLSSSQKATMGVTGVSHNWDVDTASIAAGATSPSSTVLLDHITTTGKITCGTCHDPHKNTNPPFLRLDNSADQLCLDCHSARNVSSVRTYTGNILSHPVNVVLPSTSTFHNPPLDTDGNPQPSDGNTTNDYLLGAGDEVRCTSCHGIHKADSDSGTIDN